MKNYTIAVAGTGYVGLSIATLLAQHHRVVAVDVIPEKVEKINNRISPIQDEYIEKYLAEKELNLTATLDGASAYREADFVVIAAPTNYDPVKNYFDTSHVEEVIDLVLEVNPDAVMVIKSTIPVGYCRSLYVKYAEKFRTSPALAGKKFNLLFSPEFLRESKALYDNLYPSRIIVGFPKLTAGLVPWFYFSEALNNGTNALLEYNYLVKKVVFKISILPIIKIIAATFIHVFFVCLLLIVAAIYGYYPTIYTIQIIYYSFCLFIFVLALSYTTCAVVVFFRDLSQIISIGLQIGMWATPILWNLDALSSEWIMILKLNPLVYIVNGYRSAIYEKEWFFQDFFSTMYFWIVTVVLFGLGAVIFKRLKVHFADVL